nr:unnamed protein product [Spirometra erinaceieuropaei]
MPQRARAKRRKLAASPLSPGARIATEDIAVASICSSPSAVSFVMRPTGVAVFGLGRAGKIHLANILRHPGFQLKYAVDPSELPRTECRAMLPSDHRAVFISGTKEELNELFADDTVNAVFVCSQTDSHYSITRTALMHGKAVFCEKPISLNVAETEELYRIAAAKGLPLHCSFNR